MNLSEVAILITALTVGCIVVYYAAYKKHKIEKERRINKKGADKC